VLLLDPLTGHIYIIFHLYHFLCTQPSNRGDMQPFVQLGLRLQRDGHRVRLATHACFRDYVQGKGLEFYPLAGDPLKLSEFMVKTQGFVIPTTPELIMQVSCNDTLL